MYRVTVVQGTKCVCGWSSLSPCYDLFTFWVLSSQWGESLGAEGAGEGAGGRSRIGYRSLCVSVC